MASSGRPDITISPIFYTSIRQNYPLPGVFPKTPLLALFLSNFFQKNFTSPLVLSQKHPEKVTPFLNFFKKLSSPLLIISFSPPKRCTVFKKIEKFLFPYLPYHQLGAVFEPFSPQKQAAKKRVALPLYRVISKTTPRCVATFGKNSEKHHLPPLTIAITPLFCNPLFQLFFKNFCLSTADYHFFASKRSHLFKKFFKKNFTLLIITFFLRFVSAFLKKVKNLPERE